MAQEFGTPITPTPEEPKKNNTTLIIIVVVVAVLLCCCCLALVFAYYYGDTFMRQIGINYTSLSVALPAI